MFSYLHNGTTHTDTSKAYMKNLGLDDDAIEGLLNQKAYEESLPDKIIALTKSKGVEFNGVSVMLNESNQNGLSAIKSAFEMAKEFDLTGEFFPINFNCETQKGIEVLTLKDESEFKEFGIKFILARKALFD